MNSSDASAQPITAQSYDLNTVVGPITAAGDALPRFHLPTLGLGTYKVRGAEQVQRCVAAAVAAGYRHIDTAAVYRSVQYQGLE